MKFFAFQAKGLRAQGPPTPPPEKWEYGHVTTRQDYLYGTVRTAAFSEQKKAAMYEKWKFERKIERVWHKINQRKLESAAEI